MDISITEYLFKVHKGSANQGKARLRGLYRIIYSKTISPRLSAAKPACADWGAVGVNPSASQGEARLRGLD
jgi:hypothetical protein